jgi:dienelactone hydrolase
MAVRRLCFLLAAAAIGTGYPAATQPAAQPLTFNAGNVGAPVSNAQAELFVPAGEGPFPAVVVLHGCDGVGRHYRIWARSLMSWGYVALLVDSFRPRGVTTVCNQGELVLPRLRARDAFNAASYLRTLPNIRADRIGVIGFSHGGSAVLRAATEAGQGDPPFAAAVALYPGCQPAASGLNTDTLILIGDADDWTPIGNCLRWRDAARTNGHVLRLKTYPGALHGFDAPNPPHMYAGHYVGRHPEAAADAVVETRAFLGERLMPPR